MHQSGCFDYWKVPLVDCFNDDAEWGGLVSLGGFAAYGDEVFLERAKDVWTVSLWLWVWCEVWGLIVLLSVRDESWIYQ